MYSLVDTIIENNVGVDSMNKPMSEQMQKLADRYEKATGKKFDAQTNAQKIRSMSDEELAEFLWNFNLADVSTDKLGEFGPHMFRCRLKEWLQMPAEEDKYEAD